MSYPGSRGTPHLPPPATYPPSAVAGYASPTPRPKSALPFVGCVVLAIPVVFALLLGLSLLLGGMFGVTYGILQLGYWATLGLGVLMLVIGTIGSITRESSNARIRAQAHAPGKPATPFVAIAVLGPLVVIALFLVGQWRYFGGGLFGLILHVLAIIALLVTGISVAVIRSRSRATPSASPSAPIGYTTDGQPIYPVVGYTPDGRAVTADRAVGLQPRATGTNAMAIVALIMAFVVPFLAIIFGHVARSQIRRTGEDGAGMALAGLIIGYLSIAAYIVAVVVVVGVANS